jgi:hypothetical protein
MLVILPHRLGTQFLNIRFNQIHKILTIVLSIINKKFWGELIAYFSLIPQGPHRKRRVQQFYRLFFAAGTCLPGRFLAPNGGIHLTEPLPSNDKRATHKDTQTDGRDL